jgi:transcriptional regulator with XRE-family HTH domain
MGQPKTGRRVAVTASKRMVTAMDQTIGRRVRARRLEMGISQDDVAQQLGITFQQVQKYEKGSNRIGSSRLVQIADILQVDTSYFLADLKSNGNALSSRFVEFMATKDYVAIVDAMIKLEKPGLRRSVIDLARKLGSVYGS